jgi:hypothetical protein
MPESLESSSEPQLNQPEQQYIEGPWARVSGETPLESWELKALSPTLDSVYGAANWNAHPVDGQENAYAITVSPDAFSTYASVARGLDEAGMGGHPSIRQSLQDLAIAESEGRLRANEGDEIESLPAKP